MKKIYFAPKITLQIVECEEGIAAYSASITVGGMDGSGMPYVEDWENEAESGNHFTL